jgi:uncharacterized protein YecE (DUF72 family)
METTKTKATTRTKARPRTVRGRPSRAAGKILIGCSGWQYAGWRGRFYPSSLPAAQELSFYARRFETVELNNSFYRLPERATFARWAAQTPSTFVMAVKASRYLTHLKRLRDPAEPMRRLLDRIGVLGRRLGPILYQLQPTLAVDLPRLEAWLAVLPRAGRRARPRIRHVVEFRHPSWYREDVYAALARRGVAVCLHDRTGSAYAGEPIGPFVYIRFHGTHGDYHGSYRTRTLRTWADRIRAWAAEGRDVFAYFNNDPGATAARNAAGLIALVAR